MNRTNLRSLPAIVLALGIIVCQTELVPAQAPQGKPLTIRGKIAAVENSPSK